MDKYHGQGGTYEVVDGERRLVKGSTTEHHKDGDGARDAEGKTIGPAAADKPEPALPAPQAAPWATDKANNNVSEEDHA